MGSTVSSFLYLISGICFIIALRGLSHPATSRAGNYCGVVGMVIAIFTTLTLEVVQNYAIITVGLLIGGTIGTIIARKIQMTALPQLVAAFHSLVGLSACFVAIAAFYQPEAYSIGNKLGLMKTGALLEVALGLAIGAITFTGSIVAFGKLQGTITSNPLIFSGQHVLNALMCGVLITLVILLCYSQSPAAFWLIFFVALVLGCCLVLPIGGADMPIVVSMLNSYSGWAATGIGFTLNNHLMIITGALVGSSGAILCYIMCKGMNRSFFSVIIGGFGKKSKNIRKSQSESNQISVKEGDAEEAAFMLKQASSVVIVPGYGMAVAQAQHALREMANLLKAKGVVVRYAIHPVAGRMPGHMNVLLAEANVPYEDVLELDEVNIQFAQTDVAFVIGANDVTNPAAKNDPSSPIYGMPILDVENAKSVLFAKRSMAFGYAGVENDLFFRKNTLMLFGDAKKMCEKIIQYLN
ncbi:NAD(P) transhydrogenase subunit beta [Candidatus Endolissoclinum faulkneri L5]|uniref:NAD(P) transhydrogenase subunit beta n=1 Tax=Candidatus Endolissoclinum faulkneri L5 TaxID=1401328 RepID=V9TV60_9PROT|nr:NAD(P)(+) transhydrogenase (Re/Si-specific) subunit beta [Candidatus Endolissoclinum faulkneri]AHC73588.1 NAD(P) transhydrogenase subunit beta [Candidatus Endolissoclinum faulkneri L5]